MYHVGWLGSYITRGVYTVSGPFHPFGGAVDIIVVQQPDGTFKSSPWYVRFGKFQGVLKAREKEVSISVNGVDADFHMYLDPGGEAYFLREVEGEEGGFVSSNLGDQIEGSSREILPRARSRRSRLFGLVFGRNSIKKDSYKEGDDISSLERAEIAANLLDVKWSTNLSAPIKDDALVSSASNASEGEGDKLRVIDDGEMPVDSAMREGKEESSSCDVQIGIGSRSSVENQELLIEETNAVISSSGTAEQMVETISETNCSGAQEDLGGNGIQSFVRSEKSEDLVTGLEYLKEESEGLLNGDELQFSKESVIDVEDHDSDFDTTKAASAPAFDSSDEEQFPFSDLTDSKYRESEKASGCPDFADKEDCSPSSPFKNQLSDIEELIENSKIASNAIPIHVNTGAEVGHLTGSVPNIWSQFDNFGADDDFGPLSHSLDSNFISMEWKTPSNEKECCTNSDIDKENQLLPENASNGSQLSENEDSAGDPTKTVLDSGGSWGIWPFNRSRAEKVGELAPVQTISTNGENVSQSNAILGKDEDTVKPKMLREKVRENTPTSEELATLNLKEGCNLVTFTFSTAMLGKQKVDARIFLWKWNGRIVISDVDGTITKSDVLGQFMPLVGVDWSQTGVAHLFSAIKENGYQLLFLSARAISQAYITRQFLVNLKQDGKALPDGPVVISPDGLFPSLFREVIRRAPHEFKIACLEDIKALFPSDCNPFYAGFGNRDTDEFTYLKVGIPKGKIFTINPKGEVFAHGRFDSKSYSSLHALVHEMFPPVSSEQEDFNSWNFWRLPPPDIEI